ncbi:TonB-dependent receptor [Wenzhouxiangella sp. EGI_FJ10305]|uniref:TonB-dependent receptor n=1 Tax=Wenzhouxiangella sp. EGI_FJ10305 TaxID=3243768 RepID=UPI0035D9CC97
MSVNCPLIRLAGLTAAIALAPGIGAQEASEEESAELSRIKVTAQKREQTAQDVPISITAYTEQDLERSGIDEFIDYASRTPNVGFSQQGNRAFTKIGIRGVTNVGGRANAVGVYLDEFNIAPNILVAGWSRTLDTPLYDIERIEILRGPQGTYFGRNTLGGAINITSRKPDPVMRFGSLRLEADEHGTWLTRLAANLPTSEQSALRLTGYYQEIGDWMNNLSDGGTNDGRDQGVRAAFRYDNNDNATVDISLARSERRQNQLDFVPTGVLAPIPQQLVGVTESFDQLFAPFGAPAIDTSQFPDWPFPATDAALWPDNFDTLDNDTPRRSDSETDMLISRIQYGFANGLELTSVTGYLNDDFSQSGDGDASPYPAFRVDRDSNSRGWSQELRLSSFGQGPLEWTLGAIYAEDEVAETDLSAHLESDPYLDAWGALLFALGVDSGQVDLSDPEIQFALSNGLIPQIFGPMTIGNFEDVDRGIDTESFAVFGDLTYALTDDIDLSAGLRYTRDDVTFSEVTRPTITIPVGSDVTSEDFSDISPRIAVNWHLTEGISTYATMARGYKVGGINSDVTLTDDGAVEKVYDEETAWNYEIGFKGMLADNRIQLNAAAFYIDWDDIQVRGQDVLTQRQFVQNATSANSQGVEIELLARLTGDLTWNLGYGYTDASFDDFPNAIPVDQIGSGVVDATDNRLPFAPENSLTSGIEYRFNGFAETEGWFRIDYRYTDEQFTEATNNSNRVLPSFNIVDARVGFESDRFSLAVYAQNLLDEEYTVGVQNLETYYSGLQRAVGAPRTVGAVVNLFF